MASHDLRFSSEGAVQFMAAASIRRARLEADWLHTQADLKRHWPRPGRALIALVHEGDQGLDAEDATDFLTALAHLPHDHPVDVILHTHGGAATAANRIAAALVARPNTAAFVPFYAESAGTEVALATEEVFLGKDAHLSPIDIQIEGLPARDLVKLARKAGAEASEKLQLSARMAERMLRDEARTIDGLIHPQHKKSRIKLAKRLTGGYTYHGERLGLGEAKKLGIAVSAGVPAALYGFIGKRRAQLRQLRELEANLLCIHRREAQPAAGATVRV